MRQTPTIFAVLVGLGLTASSCGLLGSYVLTACGGPIGSEVDGELGSAEGITLMLEEQLYRPNDVAVFTWMVADGVFASSGDEWVIECWDGESWKEAWLATKIYSDDLSVQYLDNDVAVTDDGFEAATGTTGGIAIPSRTPDGLYREREVISFPDRKEVRALFTVQDLFALGSIETRSQSRVMAARR
jgi:hypothetical protein